MTAFSTLVGTAGCDALGIDLIFTALDADTSTTSLPAGFYTPETLASYLGISTSTIYSWNSSGYGPAFVKLGNLVRYTFKVVELWLARQLELSRG